MAKQTRGIASLAAQSKLQEYEARLKDMNINESNRVGAINSWQIASDARVRTNIVKKRLEELNQRREVDLDARRARLASKLMREDAALKIELINSKETPEERRAKLADRARLLASTRETERQQMASSLYEKAFQEDCDVLRETNSLRVLYRTLEERTAQIEQRMAAKIMEEEEKQMFHEMNEQERLKSIQRGLDDKRKALELREDTVRVLDEQIRAINLRKEENATARQQEMEELQALWGGMSREEAEQDELDKERMRALGAELHEFNRIKKINMSEKDRVERELDLRILQEALGREAEDERREAAAKAKRMDDMRHYREQLAVMMAHEAENDAERESLIQTAFAEQQAKSDAEMEVRAAAKRALMAQVDAIRQEQIAHKQQQRHLMNTTRASDLAATAEADVLLDTAAARKATDLRKRNLMGKLELQTQMVSKAHIRAAEEDEKLRDLEVAKETEAEYMAKVQTTLSKSDPPQWYGRQKVSWYS